jgi:hypothetical protein
MTERGWNDELSDEEIAQLDALLESPALWDEPEQADEEMIVAAILAEAGTGTPAVPLDVEQETDPAPIDRGPAEVAADTAADEGATVVPISSARRWFSPALSAAAGFVIALVGVGAILAITGQAEDGEVELALAGTDLAPEAQAVARIVDLPAGTRVELDVSMLDPAPPGTYYEVWLRQDAEVGVSAGTFHLRGGDSAIELWAGVSAEDYPLVTVTIQEEAQTESSGRVVLRGLLEP